MVLFPGLSFHELTEGDIAHRITTVLVSRFILDLQEVHQYRADPQLASLPTEEDSNLSFRVIGSLGSSLPPPGHTSISIEDDRLGSTSEDAAQHIEEADEVVGGGTIAASSEV